MVIELTNPDDLTSARNNFPAVVRDIFSVGPFLKISLDCGFAITSFVTREAFAVLDLREGMNVFISFKATAVHLIRTNN